MIKPFNRYFDHTLLKPEASQKDILKICRDAVYYKFASVCVNGCYVSFAAKQLKGSDVKVSAVSGFPLGAMSTDVKYYEIKDYLTNGAGEIDMVINIGALKDGKYDYVKEEITSLSKLCHEHKATLKVILETCLLSEEEIINACIISEKSGADFVKTSTGFSTGGATTEHVRLMKKTVGSNVQIKASGGIRTLEDALKMIDSGADRLGCSASVDIMEKYLESKNCL